MGNQEFTPKPLAEIVAPRPAGSRTKTVWRGRPGEPKPLWAILGQEPPADWRPPEAAPLATAPGERGGPGLYVTGHPIFGIGPTHTAIEYVPGDKKAEPAWISAGPKRGRLVSGADIVNQADERSSDLPEKNVALGRITPPPGMSAAEYWDLLKSLDARYGDRVDYDLLPEIQDSYNSNSYTRGLLDASGGSSTAPFDDYYGGRSPLPARHFASPHLRDTRFPDSLKPQPAPHFRRLP